MKTFSMTSSFLVLLFFLGLPLVVEASDETSYTLDFPLSSDLVTPPWLGKPEVANTTLGTLNLPITPPGGNNTLLVTFIFQEKESGFLRASWLGPQNASCLSDNLYENIGMSNQRSLLIDPTTLHGGGNLTLQASSAELGVQRIKFEWLKPQTALVTPVLEDTLVTTEDMATQKSETLNGQPLSLTSPIWLHQVVTAPLTDAPERVEQGVEYSLQLDRLPQAVRLALKENGLPFGQRLVVWVNQVRVGTISPAVPDLNNPGYLDTGSFTGWRDGSIWLPFSYLKVGVNTVQFSPENDVANNEAAPDVPPSPLALKDITIQIIYPPLPISSPLPPIAPPAPSDETTTIAQPAQS